MNYNQQQQYNQQPFGQGGMYYNQPKPTPKMGNPLSPEQIQSLQKSGSKFSINVSEEEFARAICTHKMNMNFATYNVGDGYLQCKICGEKFRMIELPDEDVAAAVELVKNIFQTTKTAYVDIPESVAAEYFQIIPLLEKLPQMYRIAMDNLAKYEPAANTYQTNNMNAFGALSAITMSPGYTNFGAGNPQGQGYNFGQPNGQQQFDPRQFQQQQQQQTFNPYQNNVPPNNGFGNNNPFGYEGYNNQQQPNQCYDPNQNQQQMHQNQQMQNNQQQPQQQNQQSQNNQQRTPDQNKPVVSTTKIMDI